MGLAAVLAACGTFDPNKASVGIGTAAYLAKPVRPYAWLYLPYAQMASLTYHATDTGGCPQPDQMRGDDAPAARKRFAALDQSWECWRALPNYKNCSVSNDCQYGLGFHIWRRRDCREMVIAYRGTDRNDPLDWLANLRWFLPSEQPDEYEQVSAGLKEMVSDMRRRCPGASITATGHSLGGGLAQFSGFRNARIAYVYAFDPSPVTAYFDVNEQTLRRTTQRLGIDRIYESGEVLSLPRYLTSGFFATSQCRPFIRIVRFNVILKQGLIFGHSMGALADGLRDKAGTTKPNRVPTGFAQAHNCGIVIVDRGNL
jgi:hypothetical protein